MRELAGRGWGSKRIAKSPQYGRRYLRDGAAAEVQERPAARRLDTEARAEAVALFDSTAEGNAVVIAEMLAEQGVAAIVRTVQWFSRRAGVSASHRSWRRCGTRSSRAGRCRSTLASAGVDRGQEVTVHFLAALLSYSHRMFVKAFPHERQNFESVLIFEAIKRDEFTLKEEKPTPPLGWLLPGAARRSARSLTRLRSIGRTGRPWSLSRESLEASAPSPMLRSRMRNGHFRVPLPRPPDRQQVLSDNYFCLAGAVDAVQA